MAHSAPAPGALREKGELGQGHDGRKRVPLAPPAVYPAEITAARICRALWRGAPQHGVRGPPSERGPVSLLRPSSHGYFSQSAPAGPRRVPRIRLRLHSPGDRACPRRARKNRCLVSSAPAVAAPCGRDCLVSPHCPFMQGQNPAHRAGQQATHVLPVIEAEIAQNDVPATHAIGSECSRKPEREIAAGFPVPPCPCRSRI